MHCPALCSGEPRAAGYLPGLEAFFVSANGGFRKPIHIGDETIHVLEIHPMRSTDTTVAYIPALPR